VKNPYVIHAHCCRSMRELADGSIDTVFTSPPYWALRNYGGVGEIGREKTVDEYVESLVEVFCEIKRVLKPSGSVWLVTGDTYKNKSLVLAPERLAIALLAQGWLIRNALVWRKSDPLPESVKDRLARMHERVFHLVKSRNYYYSLEPVRIPHRRPERIGIVERRVAANGRREERVGRAGFVAARSRTHHPNGKNPGDVFTCATSNFSGHPAAFPEKLVEPRLLSTTPPGGTVLDPFAGAGTVGLTAIRNGFPFIGYEINPDYVELANQRLSDLVHEKYGHAATGVSAWEQ